MQRTGLLVAIGVLCLWQSAKAGWRIETADANGYVGQYSSLKLDGAGLPRISYAELAGSNMHLRYAAWNGTSWSVERVDTSIAWCATSLALDSLGRPYIAYCTWGGQIRCAAWTGSAWNIQNVALAGNTGSVWCSLVLNSADEPAIAFYDTINGVRKCDAKRGGVERSDVMARADRPVWFACTRFDGATRITHRRPAFSDEVRGVERIELDHSGRRQHDGCARKAHGSRCYDRRASLLDYTGNDLKYARGTARRGAASGWNGRNVRSSSSLALDLAGRPRIAT